MISKQSFQIKNILAAGFMATALFMASCNKNEKADPVAPTAETISVVANVTSTSAQLAGNVTGLGTTASLTAVGVCYSPSNQNPSINDTKTNDGTDYGFKSILTSLTPNTTYYARAYIQSDAGVGYGSVITFKTSATGADTTVTVSTLAGNSTGALTNGTGTNASFNNPQGVAVDAQGNIYVADASNHVIRKVTPAGVTTTFAGSGVIGFAAGTTATAQFYSPQGVAVDASNNVYVTDQGNNAVYKISGSTVTILAGDGTVGTSNGTGSAARFNAPQGIAADAQGNVYVADRSNNRIRKITSAGVVTTFAGSGSQGSTNATGTDASFYRPTGIAIDANNNLYVADQANNMVRKITAAGVVSTVAGNSVTRALLNTPTGIAVDAQNNLYITDQSGRLLKISSGNILYTLAGKTETSGFADGGKTTALFASPTGIAVDAAKNIYIGDLNNNRIRKVVVQ